MHHTKVLADMHSNRAFLHTKDIFTPADESKQCPYHCNSPMIKGVKHILLSVTQHL